MQQAPNEDGDEFLTRLAWLYFVEGMTQSEISEQLRVTRLRVNKGLGQARARGLVQIALSSPFAPSLDLADRLVKRFGLRAAHVGIANRRHHDPHQAVGVALAHVLEEGLSQKRWRSIGVAWGKTIETMLGSLKPRSEPEIEIVSMIGGTMIGKSFNTFGVAANMARRLGARHSVFAAPIYFETAEITRAVLASHPFADHMRKASAVDLAILVTGDLSDKSYLMRDGLPGSVTAEELGRCGAVGDVLGQFLDAQGRLIEHPLNERVVGVPVASLQAMPHVLLAAAGAQKVAIMLAQMRAGFVHSLVTDDVTAELLLEAADG